MISLQTLQKEEVLVITYQTSKCPKAFGELYEMFYESLYNYTCKIVNNADDAFDITQDTFIQASKELHKLRQPITFRFWLFRIAKNMCTQQFRKAARHNYDSYDTDTAAQDYDTTEAVEKEILLTQLSDLMTRLNPEEQFLLLAKYSEGKSIKELMKETNLGSSAIKMKLMRARQKVEAGIR